MEYAPAGCAPTTLERASAFNEPGFIFEEKLDGIRVIVTACAGPNRVTGFNGEITKQHAAYLRVAQFPDHCLGCVFDGELMPSGEYYIFDMLAGDGVDLRTRPLSERKGRLSAVCYGLPEFVYLHRWHTSFAGVGEFGEGVVVKDLRAPYGRGWWKAKRIETDDVAVVSVDVEKQSAEVLGGGRVSGVPGFVQPGDVIEVEFFKRFESGKLRNGRFVRLRDDKHVRNDDSRYERVSASS
jgi:ATP-dependent DNA ligase